MKALAAARALTLAVLLISTASAAAQTTTTTAATAAKTATTTTTQTSPPEDTSTGPVAVPEPTDKAKRYHESGNYLWVVGQLWGLLVPALFLFTGLSARLRTRAQKIGKGWFLTFALYMLFFVALTFLIDLPLSYYTGFVRQHDYDLSNQTLSKWTGDEFKGLMVTAIISVLFLWVPFALIKKSPRRWWLYTGLLVIPFFALILFIAPMWIEPLFNDFGPMKDKVLEAKILALADRAGIEGSRVFEVNKSVDTKALNAYVTGFLSSKRIVLWDTIIARLSPRELLSVMGHEMGHYVLGHVWQAIIFFSFISIVSLFAAHHASRWAIARWGSRFGFTELSDVAALPLIIVLLGVFGLVIAPIANAYSRHQEHQADQYSLDLTHDNHAMAKAFVKLQQENLAVPRPGPLYTLFRLDHPSIGDRIDFCNAYRPAEK